MFEFVSKRLAACMRYILLKSCSFAENAGSSLIIFSFSFAGFMLIGPIADGGYLGNTNGLRLNPNGYPYISMNIFISNGSIPSVIWNGICALASGARYTPL
jgi:hypothetical protein